MDGRSRANAITEDRVAEQQHQHDRGLFEHYAAVGTGDTCDGQEWRIRERMKTVSVALVLCLNIGVDPPDVLKPQPCAKLECWADPLSAAPQKALEHVGKALQAQYEVWQPRARYKPCLDPTADELKKIAAALRRNAKEERVLFHYNGHGVPKPTSSGELWVFNKNYTQYIPVSIYDLQSWLGSPSILVYDCSAAGHLLRAFDRFAEQRESDTKKSLPLISDSIGSLPQVSLRECIQLAACAENQLLPMNPELPADLFTSCLTTPIEIALRWFISQNTLFSSCSLDDVAKLPGKLNDRRTPLGEMNWIFTAITDTIAWNLLSKELFKKLFRQDLMVAALFRNYLLAERIMRTYNCTPLSSPALPVTHHHRLWNAWDLACDMCLSQLNGLIAEPPAEYIHSTFFTEQLIAFEIWLDRHTFHFRSDPEYTPTQPPEQLPIVLQVLLSQAHRLRALVLLGRFLDLSTWTVHQALTVGIFPYVLKLLQSPSVELKHILVFIWSRLVAVDQSCQADLLKDSGYLYFAHILTGAASVMDDPANANLDAEVKKTCAFILCIFVRNFPPGHEACVANHVPGACLSLLTHTDAEVRLWSVVCLAQIWKGGEVPDIHSLELVREVTVDEDVRVRAAAIVALGTVMSMSVEHTLQQRVGVWIATHASDESPIVRGEVVIALSQMVYVHREAFVQAAMEFMEEEQQRFENQSADASRLSRKLRDRFYASAITTSAVYSCIFKYMLVLSTDPDTEVSVLAMQLVDFVNTNMLNSHYKPLIEALSKKDVSKLDDKALLPLELAERALPVQQSTNPPTSRPQSQYSHDQRKRMTIMDALPSGRGSTDTLSDNTLQRSYSHPAILSLHPPTSPSQHPLPFSSSFISKFTLKFTCHREPSVNELTRSSYRKGILDKMVKISHPTILKFDKQLGAMSDSSRFYPTTSLSFHPTDDILASSSQNSIQIWNWRHQKLSSSFQTRSNVSSLTWIEDIGEHAVLLTGSDDDTISVHKISDTHTMYVTSWFAFVEPFPSRSKKGMVLDWCHWRREVVTAGNSRLVKIWNLEKEQCSSDMATRSQSCVTGVVKDKIGGDLVVAGCDDGSVRVLDRRLPSRESYEEHQGSIVGVEWQDSSLRVLASASTSGDVRFWDTRLAKSTKTIDTELRSISTFSLHHFGPVMAVGNQSLLKIYNILGNNVKCVRQHDKFLGYRLPSITSTAFHPYQMLMASSGSDSSILLWSSDV